MASTSSSPTTARRQSGLLVASRLWLTGLLAAVVAAVACGVIRTIGVAVGAVPSGYTILQPARIIVVAVLVALVATALLAALARWTRRPVRTFRIIAVVFLIVSLLGPLGAGGDPSAAGHADGATVVAMLLMHVVTAAIIVGVLTAPRRMAR